MVQAPPLGYEEHWHIELVSLSAESKVLLKQHSEAMEDIEEVRNVLN